jgi:hypothetical protein
MTSQGTPHGRFQRALSTGTCFTLNSPPGELDSVSLADALALTIFIARHDPERL